MFNKKPMKRIDELEDKINRLETKINELTNDSVMYFSMSGKNPNIPVFYPSYHEEKLKDIINKIVDFLGIEIEFSKGRSDSVKLRKNDKEA